MECTSASDTLLPVGGIFRDEKVLQLLERDEYSNFVVLDVFKDISKFVWDRKNSVFVLSSQRFLLTSASSFPDLMRDRMEALIQRVKSSSLFHWWLRPVDPTLSYDRDYIHRGLLDSRIDGIDCDKRIAIPLKPVECALGCREMQTIIGYIFSSDGSCKDESDIENVDNKCSRRPQWFICDLEQKLNIDASNTRFQDSYFVEGCIVIASGIMSSEGKFVVLEMTHPPRAFQDDLIYPVEMLGGEVTRALKDIRKKAHREYMNTIGVQEILIVVSEVNLDCEAVFENLLKVLRWAEQALVRLCDSKLGDCSKDITVPVGIILMGNFYSGWSTFNFTAAPLYVANFSKLREALLGFPYVLKYCHLILIPGHKDPGPRFFPKPPIPPTFTDYLPRRLKQMYPYARTTLASNPCRLRYRSREIVICRQNLTFELAGCDTVLHMAAESKYSPTEEESAVHLSRLILGQAHLRPLPINNTNNTIALDFDYTLRLHPLPDMVFIGDVCNAYAIRGYGTSTVLCNPGILRCGSFGIYNIMTGEATLGDV